MSGTGEETGIILTSCAVIASTTVVRKVIESKYDGPKIGIYEPIAFGFFLAMGLLAMALVAPRIAVLLSLLGLVGAFAVNGPPLFKLIGKLGQ